MKQQENNLLIHLIAPKNKDKWHPIWKHCYKFWENSNYNIKLWNDEDIDQLLKEDDKEFYEILNTLPNIFKFDYIRYIILEKFGGAYFDMDVEVIRDFLPLLNLKKIYIVESSHQKDEYVQNSIMISLEKTWISSYFWNAVKKHSKFKVKTNIENCKNYFSKLPGGTNVRETVGPIMLSEVYKAYSNSNFQLLSHLHFNNTPHDIKICNHHQTGNWGIKEL
jgi:mannosyltransferase OCH1-like enzyme